MRKRHISLFVETRPCFLLSIIRILLLLQYVPKGKGGRLKLRFQKAEEMKTRLASIYVG